MTRLPWLIRTRLSPYEILKIAQENKFRKIFLSHHGIVCCVYSLESTYHYCVEDRKVP